jgi:two-component system, NtrC family, response regulator HydG
MNPKLRLLIVDDDQRMTRTLCDILFLSGHTAVDASSGASALAKVSTQEFDCVLTDVRMPGMDGVEFHRQLRQSHPGLPVILMTAYAADDIIRQGLDDGVVGVLDKPLDINHLLDFFASLGKNRVIAIVDDDPNFCKTLAGVLQQRGFNVTQITDPHTPVQGIASASQVVLLDMKLDGVGGLNVLKEIRLLYPTLPVVLVTGYRQEMDTAIKSALEINAYACLYKPLEIPELLDMLSRIQLLRLRDAIKKN